MAEHPREGVFAYFDGAREVWADPLALHRRLVRALDGDPNRTLRDVAFGLAGARADYPDEDSWEAALAQQIVTEPLRYEAEEKLVVAVRHVFEMVPFDRIANTGATERHCRDALAAFMAWLDDCKKKA